MCISPAAPGPEGHWQSASDPVLITKNCPKMITEDTLGNANKREDFLQWTVSFQRTTKWGGGGGRKPSYDKE